VEQNLDSGYEFSNHIVKERIYLTKMYINWMQCDILFAEYVRSECEKNDIPCIINDGLISKDEMFEKVKKKVNINQYNTQTKMKIMGQMDKQSVQQHPFPPLYDKDSKVLILGSFPSVKSREMKFFYGHPQNRFWKVIASIFDQENPTSIEEKKKLILDNHLALWDVIAECEISGSSDASIKNAKANDLSEIIKNSKIQKIIVNGKTAERLYIKYIEPVTGIKAVVLPSTSPANAAWSLERLVDVWKSEIKN